MSDLVLDAHRALSTTDEDERIQILREMERTGSETLVAIGVDPHTCAPWGYLAKKDLPALTRAQYEVQRKWLVSGGSQVAEALVMFACLPGMAGVPTPTGGMGLWLPITETVSLNEVSRVFSDSSLHP